MFTITFRDSVDFHSDNATPRTDIPSLSEENSLGASEVGRSVRRTTTKYDTPIDRRSTTINLTPDVLSWYSAPFGGGSNVHVRRETSNLNTEESLANLWSNSCHFASHRSGTSATLDRRQLPASTSSMMKTLP